MVKFQRKFSPPLRLLYACQLAACLLAACLPAACSNDLLGLFRSDDLEERWRERGSFKFLANGSRTLNLGENYSFIVITDTHIENGDAHGLEKLKNLVDNDPSIKFVVINGDITQCGYREDIQKFIEIARSLPVPCYPVIGNHDIYFGSWPQWRELIGSTSYRIDGGGQATLFIMDSANAAFGKDQIDWLERELKSAQGKVFIFSHVNLFVKSPVDIQQFTDIRERARLTSLLKGRCDAMFMGHVHRRMKKELGGVQYITIEDFRDNSTYCRVSVSKDKLRWEFKKL